MEDNILNEMLRYIQSIFTQQLENAFVKEVIFDDNTALELSLLLDEFAKESTRARPIFVTDMLDKKLVRLLRQYLINEKKENIKSDSLLGDFKPIQSFSSRITLAYRIGLIDDLLHNELKVVNKIRRIFAHNWMADDFDENAVKYLENSYVYNLFSEDTPISEYTKAMQISGFRMHESELRFILYILTLYVLLIATGQIAKSIKRVKILKDS